MARPRNATNSSASSLPPRNLTFIPDGNCVVSSQAKNSASAMVAKIGWLVAGSMRVLALISYGDSRQRAK